MKTCNTCQEPKPFSEFYKHPKTADGYLGRCKACHKREIKRVRDENVSRYREYDRTRYHTDPERQENARKTSRKARETGKHTEYTRNWRDRNPEKYAAQNAVNNAIRDGRLKRENCSVCGAKAHAHHEDYSKPLEVIWLCPEHHSGHHLKSRTYE